MPRVKTLQIVWHGKEPVYSLDFHSNGTLVTAGADKEVKLWEVTESEDGCATVNHLHTLTGHSKTVNCVRFSPSGSCLVSGGDGGEIILWQPSDQSQAAESWKRTSVMRGHTDDVMDLGWAQDGTALLSGSIDNKAIVWEVSQKRRGHLLAQLANHKHFVQGVAWDPAQQFVVTQSADRTCKVYSLRPPAAGKKNKVAQHLIPACETGKEFYCSQTLSKQAVTLVKDGETKVERQPLFHDESIPSFFRRLAWSPDGSFLLVPAGLQPSGDTADPHTVYIFARGQWAAPVAHLPGHTKPVVAVRFCPTVFKRDNPDAPPNGPFNLPYKAIFAVATLGSVVIYDTDHAEPLAVLGHLHYDSITDLAWSADGRYLAIASRDCYCSIAVFEPEELGVPTSIEGLAAARKEGVASAAAAAAQVQVGDKDSASPVGGAEGNTSGAALDANAPAAQATTKATPQQPIAADNNNNNKPIDLTVSTSGKKRIKPTPVSNTEAVEKFENVKQASTSHPHAQPTEEPPKTKRRITPIAINAVAPTPISEAAAPDASSAEKVEAADTTKGTTSAEKTTKNDSSPPKPATTVPNLAMMALQAAMQAAGDNK